MSTLHQCTCPADLDYAKMVHNKSGEKLHIEWLEMPKSLVKVDEALSALVLFSSSSSFSNSSPPMEQPYCKAGVTETHSHDSVPQAPGPRSPPSRFESCLLPVTLSNVKNTIPSRSVNNAT
ncbi:hypothetical protein PoB_002999800 [Plakobranchus ocellatus]|uniref:Uncharacterized protein n=1 Tax=Plakobranchus ocellatus TaxID=259542 RepID=A0AAV4AA29_9GAST|nr:hypothetical protein PoB_002999800 [Plakobranchus ocellatus]